jgi:hypothetical protein
VVERHPLAEPLFEELPRLPVEAELLAEDVPNESSQSVPPAEDVKKYYLI